MLSNRKSGNATHQCSWHQTERICNIKRPTIFDNLLHAPSGLPPIGSRALEEQTVPPRGGYHTATFTRNGRCYQLDHFITRAKDMKRINYAGPTSKQLTASDHKTIKLIIKIARNLKKARAPKPNSISPNQEWKPSSQGQEKRK